MRGRTRRLHFVTVTLAVTLLSAWLNVWLPGVVFGQTVYPTVFFDDFEQYPVGIFTPTRGWQVLTSSLLDANISDVHAYGDAKSLLLKDATALRIFGLQPWPVGYQIAVYADAVGQGAFEVMLVNKDGFLGTNPDCGYCGWMLVWFESFNRTIWVGDGNQMTACGTWMPGTWYVVKVVPDPSTNTFDLWINNTLVGRDLGMYWPHEELIDSIYLRSGANVDVYFDNVSVFLARP